MQLRPFRGSCQLSQVLEVSIAIETSEQIFFIITFFVLLDHKFNVDSAIIEVSGSDRLDQVIVKMTGIQLQLRKPVGWYINWMVKIAVIVQFDPDQATD